MEDSFSLSEKFYDSVYDLLGEFQFVRSRKYQALDVACAFDIEATSFYVHDEKGNQVKQACMYCWVFGINGKCIRGRTWQEFIDVLNVVKEHYHIDLKHRIVIYVHNLSYEFQWIRKWFDWYEVFSVEERKPCYAVTTQGIMFKCSYLLSDMSLDILSRNLNRYKVRKLVGDLDYSLTRTSETPLTEKEWGYVLHDGLVVMAYIQEERERLGNILKLPNTKTGYVRNLCRDNCLNGSGRTAYYRFMKSLRLTADDYVLLKKVFAGGLTHADHRKVGKVWHNVSSYDFTSSYPAVMLSEEFPVSSPKQVTITDKEDFDRYLNTCCCMFTARFTNIRAKFDFEHYISFAKCREAKHYLLDNGRVVKASSLIISITEQDFLIIKQMYKWDRLEVADFRYMYRDYLPKPFLETILDLYEKKTTLKNVEGKEAEYMVSKAMLNSCYGMCVTDICRPKAVYGNGEWNTEKPDIDTEIENYNKGRGRFLYYPWGVWVTAYARRNLITAILSCGADYIYADTDSVKILNRQKHESYFSAYNAIITDKIRKCLTKRGIDWKHSCPVTIQGKKKPLGVWDYEGDYKSFKTLGAKRYMVVDQNDEIHITIAGVAKKAGAEYLRTKYRTNENILNHFNDSLVFPSDYVNAEGKHVNGSGKLCHTYIDEPISGRLVDYLGHEGAYYEKSAVHLEPTSYNLSLDDTFLKYVFGYEMDYIG